MLHQIGPLRIEGQFLRSRVARRIFLSVVACALLPISIFAFVSLGEVTAQLERDARERLSQDAKQIGMSSFERLLLLDSTLRVIEGSLANADAAAPIEALPEPLPALARGRFRSMAVARGATPAAGDPPLIAAFAAETREDRQHLDEGGSWLRVLEGGPGPRIAIAHLAPGPKGKRLIVAELNPHFLFASDGLRSNVDLTVSADGSGSVFSTEAQGREEALSGSWELYLRPVFRARAWTFVLSEPEDTVLAPMRQFRLIFPLVALLSLLGVGLASLILVRRQLVPIEILHEATRRIAARDFRTRVSIRSRDEFQDLGHSFNQMAESIAKHVTVMETVNAVGSALSAERDRERLLGAILRGAMSVTGARAGAVHLMDASERLERMLLRAETDAEVARLSARLDALALRCAASGEALDDGDQNTLSIPMRNMEREVIGVLQLVRPPAADPFDLDARHLAESLASQTAVALTRDRLAGEFRGLFEGLIQLLVRAIDEKSPYTGAHCRRVPILTEMIADAACGTQEGPLKDFTLSEPERYELRIAALLHDCGKVTTPVHVQDKSTKLETLFDRIGVVDARFEVVRRDLELAQLRSPTRDEAALATAIRQLEDDRAFLRHANRGVEYMAEAHRARVRAIAARWRWRGPDGREVPLLTDEEVENLTIERGTLNAHEREIINQHVVATIQMLEELPYPRSLRNVPAIAGAHHERMDGQGYPNHLRREQMSLQARILGLADVFEALTAKDRPYKEGMRVQTALDILGSMKDEGHIDADLFDVFVREKIYLRYAARWLDPEQIDEDLLDEAALDLIENARREDG
jgi:HD-GYP domain-containing protein (c-di-GMP phosphodiesterase class II)/HAMP domain-containing protein